MNKIPFEVLRHIGLFLDQQDQIQCAKLCKSWHTTFRPLVFQDVCFQDVEQITSYLKEDPSLRRLTTCLSFYTEMTEQEFEEIEKATPLIKSFTWDYIELETLSAPKIVSIIQQHWSAHLVKINLENEFLTEVLPLLKHQLQDVTGYFKHCFDEFEELIPMPQLTRLNVLCMGEGFDSNGITIKRLNDMRVTYPLLKSLIMHNFYLIALEDDDNVYTPFPFVKELYLCGLDSAGVVIDAFDPYYGFLTSNSDIVDPSIDYYGEMAQLEGFPALKKLTHLTKLTIQGSQLIAVVTKRELLDFDLLVSSMQNLPWLKKDGLFHIRTGESFDNCLSGTVGYHDVSTLRTYQNYERGGDNVSSTATYENLMDHEYYPFGNGEELIKSKVRIYTVKKKMPQPTQSEFTAKIYKWDERKPSYNIRDSLVVSTTYSLTTLLLENVTLRNPTYKWIAQHLPLLETFTHKILNLSPFAK